eukprot:TRINITY_DN32251_c0_g1_i1.p1 TRINITY_DN32251_c0_g1~~TRINITY_DN32251_c0_g1_i1.p1  ORF type:complete len:164 (-),score=61.15 TRINITY_DN32251_c0_g1_i1:19-441(-)
MGSGGRLVVALVVLWGVSSEDKVRNIDEGDVDDEVESFRDYVKIGLDLYEESEQVYNEHRGHSRFVQYNDLSKRLAADSRLVNTIRELARGSDVDSDDNDDEVSVEDSIAVVIDIVNEAEVDTRAQNNIGRSCGDRTEVL